MIWRLEPWCPEIIILLGVSWEKGKGEYNPDIFNFHIPYLPAVSNRESRTGLVLRYLEGCGGGRGGVSK